MQKRIGYIGPVGLRGFPAFSEARRVTSVSKEHFLANYYGINCFDKSSRYIAVLETPVIDREPKVNDPALLGLVDLNTNDFIPVTETKAWNFQQGCMLYWINEHQVIFNDLQDGKFVSILSNPFTGERAVLDCPVGAVSSSGKYGIGLNFARLDCTRPGYGYAGKGQDPQVNEKFPEDDGLFLVNIEKKTTKLILPITKVREHLPETPKNFLWYFTHTLFDPTEKRIFFMARSFPNTRSNLVTFRQKWAWRFHRVCSFLPSCYSSHHTVTFTANIDGTDLKPLLPVSWGGSHYDWYNSENIIITCNYNGDEKHNYHVIYNIRQNSYRVLSKGLLNRDGHCTFSPDRKWLLTDIHTGSGVNSTQTLLLVDVQTGATAPIESFSLPSKYQGRPWRCDLHARWNSKGDLIAFSSSHENSRQVYIINLQN